MLFHKRFVSSIVRAPAAVVLANVDLDFLVLTDLGHHRDQPGGGVRPHPRPVAAYCLICLIAYDLYF